MDNILYYYQNRDYQTFDNHGSDNMSKGLPPATDLKQVFVIDEEVKITNLYLQLQTFARFLHLQL